jgi:hypothetical protein
MAEAAMQGALGSAAAVRGVPPELLIETHVVALKEISDRLEAPDLSRLAGSALEIAAVLHQELAHLSRELKT